MAGKSGPRSNQQRRTRRALLDAATRLVRRGETPSLEAVAEEAMVSRATVYRYFPSTDALLVEASLDVATPDPCTLFKGLKDQDAVSRVERVDTALHDMVRANEVSIRVMLANSLRQDLSGREKDLPRRQNRRTPLLDAALVTAKDQFTPKSRDLLTKALALIVGTEAMVVFQDVLQLSDTEARKVKRWAIRALIDAAQKEKH
ncbi:MAG TPA: helix-turn-helix domain-containing protein [Rhizomicrobium sp.]|nr:helix-turn-helix domain-containing protein [Rhizomicrobium sp.]